MSYLNYNETVTFYLVTSTEYANSKRVEDFSDVRCIFLQGTGFEHAGFDDITTAGDTSTNQARCFVDPQNTFIEQYANRLEGMYVHAPLFGVDEEDAWYKVESVKVNRDHLLTNTIDNIRVLLTKSAPLDLEVS